MPFVKTTWFFRDSVNNVGWTESWWSNSTDTPTASAAFTGVIPARLALLEDTCFLDFQRCSNVDHPRDSYVTVATTTQGTVSHVTHPAAGPWDAMLIRREAASNDVFGKIFMHGVQLDLFLGRALNIGNAAYTAWLLAFSSYITALQGIPALLRKVVAGTPTYPALSRAVTVRRTEHKVGRPFDGLRGRRAVA